MRFFLNIKNIMKPVCVFMRSGERKYIRTHAHGIGFPGFVNYKRSSSALKEPDPLALYIYIDRLCIAFLFLLYGIHS